MFNDIVNDFNTQMMHNRLIKNHLSSSSFESQDEHPDYSHYVVDEVKTRIVWVTNYINNEDFPIHVSVDDPLLHIVNTSSSTIEQESINSNERDEGSLSNTLDLSKLNLDDLLLLLYRLQQRTTQNSVINSNSTTSSSSSLSSFSPRPSHAVQSSLSMLNNSPSHSIKRRQSSFTLSNIADVPKQLMTTLSKPISSLHLPSAKHIHSPNDVADKLLQSFHLRNTPKGKSSQYSSNCTYQQSQQHKAKLISNLLSTNSIPRFPSFTHSNHFSH